MNLYEINKLIPSIPADEKAMIVFYENKRLELIAEINCDLAAKQLPLLDIEKAKLLKENSLQSLAISLN